MIMKELLDVMFDGVLFAFFSPQQSCLCVGVWEKRDVVECQEPMRRPNE